MLRRYAIALALASMVAMPASAGTFTGGATEWTQIANNIQLLRSYAEQVETVRHTLDSAASLKQQLKQLDPRTLQMLNGDSLNEVNRVADLSRRLGDVFQSSQRSEDVLVRAMRDGQRMGMTPNDYLRSRAELASTRGGAYEESYKADQQQLQDTQQQMESLQTAASAASGVTSNIQGFQQMLASGARVQAQMISLNSGVAKTNMLLAKQALDRQNDVKTAAGAEVARNEKLDQLERESWERLDKREISLPSPTKYVPKSDQ